MTQTLHLVRPSPHPDDIKALVQTDRRAAMELAVHLYRRKLYHHALYIVKDGQEAFDIVQEVFIKAIRERRFFDADFKMKAWLFRVTSNLCFNVVRNRKRRGAILDTLDRPTSTAADQVDLLFEEEQQGTIMSAMDTLTEDHREILMLRYYSDLSYAEISDSLDIRLGTVMSRLSRAKGKLLEALDDSGVQVG